MKDSDTKQQIQGVHMYRKTGFRPKAPPRWLKPGDVSRWQTFKRGFT